MLSDRSDARWRLESAIFEEIAQPVHGAVVDVARRIGSRLGPTVAAVLFYGSCLRRGGEFPPDAGSILDFYVVVDGYRHTYRGWLMATANRLLPPNVFYVEDELDGQTLRAKYAVVSLRQFERGVSRRSVQVALWARYAQPARLVYARDEIVRRAIATALAAAMTTLVARTLPLLEATFLPADLWIRAFRETYRAELRSEGSRQALALHEAEPARYARLTPLILGAMGISFGSGSASGTVVLDRPAGGATRTRAGAAWAIRRIVGKLLNALRIVKAIFTFDGGLSYVLWKVERHSGVRLTVTPWQQRHPLLCCPLLAWRLYRRGAFR